MMVGYLSEGEIVSRIGEAFCVFLRWHRGQTVVIDDNGTVWYPAVDFQKWLNDGIVVD